jgi:hypothetical protein
MPDDLGITPLGAHGGKRAGAGRPRKGAPPREKSRGTLNSRRSGHSPAYIVARLARDAREGCREAAALLEGIRAGRISPFAAACEISYAKRPEPNGRGSENMARKRDWALYRVLNPHPDPKAIG